MTRAFAIAMVLLPAALECAVRDGYVGVALSFNSDAGQVNSIRCCSLHRQKAWVADSSLVLA